jgi:hypothetical protein
LTLLRTHGKIKPMNKPETTSSEEQFQARLGLEPTMMDNLRASQKNLAKRGINLTLEEVYYLEVESAEEMEDEEE